MTRLPIITHVCIHVHMLTDMEGHIVELDGYLETEQIELDRWTYFRVSSREFVKDCVVELNEYSFIYNQDETQHRNADYIAAMEQRMKDMEREEEELISTC